MNEHILRDMQPWDLPEVCSIYKQAFSDSRGRNTFFQNLYGKSEGFCFVDATVSSEVKGFTFGMPLESASDFNWNDSALDSMGDTIYLAYVGVHPHNHGSGIGSRLVERVISQSRSLGKKQIVALVESDKNLRNWYDKLSFGMESELYKSGCYDFSAFVYRL